MKNRPAAFSKNKFTGCMLGAAIGDALGKQNEGLNRKHILSRGFITDYGIAPEGCPGEKLREGQYTDDTEQMIELAQSLIECNGLDVYDFSEKLAVWGQDALNDPERKSLVGPSSALAITRLNSGMDWQYSGSDIPSCGSAMRVAPIGLFYRSLDDIEFKAALSSIPTHISKGAIAGAVAVAVGIGCCILDMGCIDIIRETCTRTSNYDPDLAERIRLSFEKRYDEPDSVFAELGTSYLAYETVPAAFYCFLRNSGSVENAILEAVNAGGDTDSIACITGALCGALKGADSLPEKWVAGLENTNIIKRLAEMIFEKSLMGQNIS